MPPRFRYKPNEFYRHRYLGGPWEVFPTAPHSNETMVDMNPGGGPCTHVKRVQALNYSIPAVGWQIENQDVPSSFYAAPPLTQLDWANLPTSTELNIIVLLAEIDEILATLTWKFWRQLSYGAITWGIVPLISEIESGLKAIRNIGKTIDGTQYEATTYSTTVNTYGDAPGYPRTEWKVTKSIKYHANGKAHYDDLVISSMLDRLGFHPDPATLWELIPFSFVVDYILPIGKFLEGLRRGGWVKAVFFDGWVSASVNSSGVMYAPSWNYFQYSPREVPFEYNAYYRYHHSSVLVAPEAPLPQFELPTFEEVFNMAYLANRKLRRIVPPIHWDWLFGNDQD